MFKRFLAEESGMEMVEWAIVGTVFAVAAAAGWSTLADAVNTAIGNVESEVSGS